jgi:hypothetical protein
MVAAEHSLAPLRGAQRHRLRLREMAKHLLHRGDVAQGCERVGMIGAKPGLGQSERLAGQRGSLGIIPAGECLLGRLGDALPFGTAGVGWHGRRGGGGNLLSGLSPSGRYRRSGKQQ